MINNGKKFLRYGLLSILLLAASFSPLLSTSKVSAQAALRPLDGTPVDTTGEFGNPFAPGGQVVGNNPQNYVNELDPETGLPITGTGLDSGAVDNSTGETNTQGGNASKGANDNNGKPPGPNTAGCSFIHLDACVAGLMNIFMWAISWFLFLAGYILDMTMHLTLNLSDLLTRVPAVDIGWKIFRDLSNIFFIFILLWIALSTILGLNSENTKELVTHLVIVALLINFSLFITKTVVDGSNIVALHFYNLIVTPSPAAKGTLLIPSSSFSGAFMEGLYIQTIYDGSAIDQAGGETRSEGWLSWAARKASGTVQGVVAGAAVAGPAGAVVGGLAGATGSNIVNWPKIILIGIFGSALMLVAAYTFLVGAVLMLFRALALMFVMMLSPLAFLAYALPGGEKYVEPWKETLLKQAIFAPVFMALSFVVVKTIQSETFKSALAVTTGNSNLASAFTAGSGGGIAMVVNFLLVIGLMWGCILVAKKLEVNGYEVARKVGSSASKWTLSGRFLSTASDVASYGFKGISRTLTSVRELPGTVAGGTKKTWETLKNLPSATGKMASGIGQKAGAFGETLTKKRAIGETLTKMAEKSSAFGTAIAAKGEALQEKYNVKKLHEKFENSAFGNTDLGRFILEQTTGRLLAGKYGGEETLAEDFKKREEMKTGRSDAEERKNALDAAISMEPVVLELKKLEKLMKENKRQTLEEKAAYDQLNKQYLNKKQEYSNLAETLETALTRMSGKGFLATAKENYKNPFIMKHASAENFTALMKDEHTLTQPEKNEAAEARWGEDHETFEEYTKARKEFEEKQKDDMIAQLDAPEDSAEQKKAKEAARREILGRIAPKLDDTLKKKMKNMRNIGELEMMNRYYGEMFQNEDFIERIPQAMVDRIRESAAFTSGGKEKVRYAKSRSVEKAVWAVLGKDMDSDTIRNMSSGQRTELKKKLEKEIRENEQAFVSGLSSEGRALHELGENQIIGALGGKGAGELAKMPSEIWNSYAVLKNMASGHVADFRAEDEDDRREIFNFIIRQSQKGTPTPSNIDAIKWFLNKKEGNIYVNFDNAMLSQPDSAALKEEWEKIKGEYADPTSTFYPKGKKRSEKEKSKSRGPSSIV